MFLDPRQLILIVKPIVLILSGIFFISAIIGWTSNFDEIYDDDTVTITFQCSQVLSANSVYPEFVIEQCNKVRANKGNR